MHRAKQKDKNYDTEITEEGGFNMIKKSKFNNKKVEFEGIKFDSLMELKYYKSLLEDGVCKSDIKIHPKFVLFDKVKDNKGKTLRQITYIADFQVGNIVVDVKGFETPVFKLKEAIFKRTFPELTLRAITKAPKYTGVDWIELSELKKIRKKRIEKDLRIEVEK